jgi:hypothetical protein
VTDVELTEEGGRAFRAEQRKRAFERLARLVAAFEDLESEKRVHATIVAGPHGSQKRWLQWERVEAAYRTFRALYVPHRAKAWARGKHDPTLVAWTELREAFLNHNFGRKDRNGKRNFTGVDPTVADVLRRYQRLQSRFAQRSPENQAKKRKTMKPYMRDYMAKRRAAAKAAKEAAHGSL